MVFAGIVALECEGTIKNGTIFGKKRALSEARAGGRGKLDDRKRKEWLLGQDSNLQPSGYKRPGISPGLGLSLHPARIRAEGAGRFPRNASAVRAAL
jgi:hypothetical protein